MDRKIEKKMWTPKKIALYSSIFLFALFIVYTIFTFDSRAKLNVETDRITVSQVQKGLFDQYIPVIGNILPIKTVYLDAIEGGVVEEIFLREGIMVEKGDPILRLASTNLLLDIMNREASLFEQINNLRNTRLDMQRNTLSLRGQLLEINYNLNLLESKFKRYKELDEKNLISREEFEKIKEEYEYLVKRKELTKENHKQDSMFQVLQIEQLESTVSYMKNNLSIAKKKLENLVIKATISGLLTSLNAEIGESKSAGSRMGQIDVLDGYKVRAGIDEHYIASIHTGLIGEFEFDNKKYKLRVMKVFPEVRDGKFEVDMEFVDDVPERIRRGQTLHIRLTLGDLTEAILLPTGGFYQKTGGQWIFVLEESGVNAVKRPIKIGRQNTQFYEVLEGLNPGDKVITSNYEVFGDAEKLILK